jgi:8-oxo-dGTP pyrophosphatase MutT (NUDIX family)
MSSEEFRGLADLYTSALRRHGAVYPVAVRPWPVTGFEPPAVVERPAEPPSINEPQIRDDAYLRARLDADPGLTNGPTVCWTSDRDGLLQVEPGRYFDMIASCGALRAEVARSGDWSDRERNPLRASIHDLVGDPLVSGAGRSAAVGVSVILTVPHGAGRALVIGQRPGDPARGGGKWHVAPSGMLEWEASGAHLRTTVLRELSEELGIELPPERVADALIALGMVQDLTMLRPDIVVRLDLRADEVPDKLRPVSEFTRLALVPLTAAGFAGFWDAHPPAFLLPHAAGAIALAQMLSAS